MRIQPVRYLPGRQGKRESTAHGGQESPPASDAAEGTQQIGGDRVVRWLIGKFKAQSLVDQAALFGLADRPLFFPLEAGDGFFTVSASSSAASVAIEALCRRTNRKKSTL